MLQEQLLRKMAYGVHDDGDADDDVTPVAT
jgi:hypothetical protein